MSHHNHPSDAGAIVTRVAGDSANAADFSALRSRTADPALLELIDALEMRAQLRALTDGFSDEPSIQFASEPLQQNTEGEHIGATHHSSSYAGWAMAAIVTIASAMLLKHADQRPDSGVEFVNHTTTEFPESADLSLHNYLLAGMSTGRVVQELPMQLVSVSAWPAGGVEVVYERRILERTTVDEVRTWAVDELGTPVLGEKLDIPDLIGRDLSTAG